MSETEAEEEAVDPAVAPSSAATGTDEFDIVIPVAEAVAESVRNFLRTLQAPSVGAIIDGSCDPAGGDVNTDASLGAGHIFFDLSVVPAVPAERITFRVRVDTNYRSIVEVPIG